MATSAVIWANYLGRGHLGASRGASQVGMVAFAAMGPLPFSLLLDIAGSYNSTFFLILILPVISATAALLATPHSRGPSPKPTGLTFVPTIQWISPPGSS